MKSVVEKWHGFWQLTGFERGVVVESALVLSVTWVALRLVGFRRWKTMLLRLAPARVEDSFPRSSKLESARVTARVVTAAARNLFFDTSCLERSTVLWWLLRSRGIPVALLVGARKQAGRFEAHAWVEFKGTMLSNENEEHAHFVPFNAPIISAETTSH